MKIKKMKKQMEADILLAIEERIAKFKEETEVGVKDIRISFGTSHDADGEIVYHLGKVKTKLDI